VRLRRFIDENRNRGVIQQALDSQSAVWSTFMGGEKRVLDLCCSPASKLTQLASDLVLSWLKLSSTKLSTKLALNLVGFSKLLVYLVEYTKKSRYKFMMSLNLKIA